MSDVYDSSWGGAKLGKLWIHAKDLLENGKQPLLPAPTFYSNWNSTVKDLASMTSKILKYLKFKSPWILRVDFSYDINAPGLFTVKDGKARIVIHGKYKNNSSACAAILAHELTHLILNSRKCREEDELENEKFTDFASAYFGLGILVLNGKHRHRVFDTQSIVTVSILGLILTFSFGFVGILFAFVVGLLLYIFSEKPEVRFGYWNDDDYHMIFIGYLVINNLDWDNVSQYVKKGTKYAGLSD